MEVALLLFALAAIGVAGALVALRAARRAESTANALAGKLVQHQLLREDLEALRERVNKLAGRYYRSVRAEHESAPETPEQVRARLRTEHGLPTIGRGKASSE